MNTFVEYPATKRSLSMRKLVSGVGINDAWYLTSDNTNGKAIRCPYYSVWTRAPKSRWSMCTASAPIGRDMVRS